MLADPLEVDRPGTAEAAGARRGQDRERAPPVTGTASSVDQTSPGEAVDEPGETAAAEANAFRQLRHSQSGPRSHLELDQDVELRQRHVVAFEELRFQLAKQGGLGIEKGAPGALFGGFELSGHVE